MVETTRLQRIHDEVTLLITSLPRESEFVDYFSEKTSVELANIIESNDALCRKIDCLTQQMDKTTKYCLYYKHISHFLKFTVATANEYLRCLNVNETLEDLEDGDIPDIDDNDNNDNTSGGDGGDHNDDDDPNAFE